ncbi:TetR/AcrR family transcriptional regulator [Hyphococcus formosus]|uniref:TetR/AcrR family transcriptional regulator n=1 Tax=Hyphococcus formosus TaxID=3143534 RepID=UPI00398A922C
MPRPRPDDDLVKERMLLAAETLLTRHGPDKVTVTDIAAQCGMSQSNAYRYFPSKDSLMAALAVRWFAETENKLNRIAVSGGPADARLAAFLETQFAIKLATHDQDPDLFQSYLLLAQRNPDAVARHSAQLSDMITSLAVEMLSEKCVTSQETAELTRVFLDMTILIRDPWLIARFRDELDIDRARKIIEVAISCLNA